MADVQPTGAFTDDGGTLRCRATYNRCLGHRQAIELAAKAAKRGERTTVDHCGLCSAWHYHKVGKLKGRRPRPPRRQMRRW